MKCPSSRHSSQAAPDSGVQISGGTREVPGPSFCTQGDHGRREGGPSRSCRGPVGDKQETRRPLPRPHRVQKENPAVAKHRDTPAARAWTRPRAPPRGPQSRNCGAPCLGEAGRPHPARGDPGGRPRRTEKVRAAPGASPAPGRRPSPRTLHSCCP